MAKVVGHRTLNILIALLILFGAESYYQGASSQDAGLGMIAFLDLAAAGFLFWLRMR